MSTATFATTHPDRLRKALNLALAPAQPITTVLCFSLGTSFDEATRSDVAEPPIIPAGYTFTIWTLIYAGADSWLSRDDRRSAAIRISWPGSSPRPSTAGSIWAHFRSSSLR